MATRQELCGDRCDLTFFWFLCFLLSWLLSKRLATPVASPVTPLFLFFIFFDHNSIVVLCATVVAVHMPPFLECAPFVRSRIAIPMIHPILSLTPPLALPSPLYNLLPRADAVQAMIASRALSLQVPIW